MGGKEQWGKEPLRISQVGSNIVRPVVQPPAHSWTSCEVGPGFAGLDPVMSGKPPRLETAQPLWALFLCLSVLGEVVGANASLYMQSETLISIYACCLSSSEKPGFVFVLPIACGTF